MANYLSFLYFGDDAVGCEATFLAVKLANHTRFFD